MLYLSKEKAKELVEHSERESPNEACGILAGNDGKVEKVYQMTNTDKSPKTFIMDPKEQLNVMKEIRDLGMKMVGIYHSHIETEAYPSAHDVELAFYPEASYIIISIKDKDNPTVRSFRIIQEKISEEKMKIK
jgi:proteasome lid subunit RPN8/RPN11